VDHLPSLDMIRLRKVTWFGGFRDEYWNMSDVEHIKNYQEHKSEWEYLFLNVRREVETELLFRNKRTG
jgi:hypothetical protein